MPNISVARLLAAPLCFTLSAFVPMDSALNVNGCLIETFLAEHYFCLFPADSHCNFLAELDGGK